MKTLSTIIAVPLLAIASVQAYADDILPLNELGFVDAISFFNKNKLVELLGEPQQAIEVTDKRTGNAIGSIWHYAYLNTNEDGDYYKSTELDFIDDKVVNIIFSNSDIEETENVTSSKDITL